MKGNVVYAVFEKAGRKRSDGVTTRIVCLGISKTEAKEMSDLLSKGGSGNEYFIGTIKLG